MRFLTMSTFALGVACSACAALSTPGPPEPTATQIPPTITVTPTKVWFPATATPTAFSTPVITPTVESELQAGAIIFEDDFTDPTLWTLVKENGSSAALGINELTIALSRPKAYLFTLRSTPILKDFYLEITAAPSICMAEDEYGILLRVSPQLEFYRLALGCDGSISLDKYFDGKPASPYPKTPSGAVPPGAPSDSRITVWAQGREMQFYVNGEYQFTLSDPSLPSGSIGLLARSNGENAVTVSFSELIVRKIIP